MAQLIVNNNEYANDFRNKINSNFTELYNQTAPLNHASTNDTYGLGTTNAYGHLRVQTGNGLSLSVGTISLANATTSTLGTVKLASSASSTSTTDVVTSKILNDATRGLSSIPRIFYGVNDPTSSVPAGSQDGDIYVKYA